MGGYLINDLVIDSESHCFLCLNEISLQYSPIQSVQYLSQCLKMDTRKIFAQEGESSLHLLTKLERSNLKVELCEECATLNKTFSTMYQQLEKIEMEVTSCLSLIHGKLLEAEEFGNQSRFQDLIESKSKDVDDGLMTKLQIVEVLRNEAMEKYSLKLNSLQPKVKLQKISMHDAIAQQPKQSLDFNVAHQNEQRTFLDPPESYYWDDKQDGGSEVKCEIKTEIDSKVEEPEPDNSWNDMEEEDSSNDVTQPVVSETKDSKIKDKVKRKRNKGKCKICHLKFDNLSAHQCTGQSEFNIIQTEASTSAAAKETSKFVIMAPTTSISEKLQSQLNPETLKYKCGSCPKEYSTKWKAARHYKTEHLKQRYKCTLCGQEFSQMSGFERHYSNIHMGLTFKCEKCVQQFKYQTDLYKHYKIKHLGIRYQCEFCGKSFERNISMQKHILRKNCAGNHPPSLGAE